MEKLFTRLLAALGLQRKREKTIYEARYEAIGRAVATELARDRHFRREVARTALGPQILHIVERGLEPPRQAKKSKK